MLGHRRLSILELSELGAQPYFYENLALVFNGELYNFKEIKKELQLLGYSFESNSDTEVLIKAFHKWREKAIEKFIGMFAFAIFDKSTEQLFLFRDRVGVKPLYYSTTKGLQFASELKFFKALPFDYTINRVAAYEYFKFGYATNTNTIYNEVQKLLPAHYLVYQQGKTIIHNYWSPLHSRQHSAKEEKVKEELRSLLISSFEYRMVSDVPVGVFLSGGVDSSLVASVLKKNHTDLNTFTIGFDHENYNEAPYAAAVAKHIGSNHHEYILDENSAKELFLNFYNIYDEPFSDTSGIPTALISKIAKEHNVKVVLSADGGDELFCGYTHYQRIANYFEKYFYKNRPTAKIEKALIKTLLKTGLLEHLSIYNIRHKVTAYQDLLMAKDLVSFYEQNVSNQSEFELDAMLGKHEAFKSASFHLMDNKANVDQMAYWDFLHFLPDDLLHKVDRATMYNSIEGREPFLDHRLVEFAFSLPLHYKYRKGKNKYILKEILGEYVPKPLFERPKKGFSIPIFQWFSGELRIFLEEYLTKEKIETTGIFNTKEVLKEYERFKEYSKQGKDYNIEKMWRILSFMMWWDKWNSK